MNSLVKFLVHPLLESEQKGIALVPGGFKPPTEGHFALANEVAKHPGVGKVIVLIGHKTRDGVTKEESLAIWNIYKKYLPSNIEFKISDNPSPITDVSSIIKHNPGNFYLPVVGIRGEMDLGDIKRFDSLKGKYDNFKTIILSSEEGENRVSGTNTRAALIGGEKERFQSYIPTELSQEEKDKVWSILQKTPLDEVKYAEPSEHDYPKLIKSLTEYMLDKGMNIRPLPKVRFIKDDVENARNFFGKTAHYDPNNRVVVLYTLDRHPKDVMRSFAHEMIHHMQNCDNRLGNITTQNTNEEGDLPEIEREAYEKGNMTFRNWTDTLTEGVLNGLLLDLPKHNYPKYLHHKLYESLQELDLSQDNSTEIKGTITDGKFTIGDITYIYSINKMDNPYNDGEIFYNIAFHPKDNRIDQPIGTSTGKDYIKILSTMYKIILDFTTKTQPGYVGISSMDNDGSKNYHNIYNNLVKNNNIPGYFKKNANLLFAKKDGTKGRIIVLKHSKHSLTEGRYDKITNTISSKIFNQWREDINNGAKASRLEQSFPFEEEEILIDANISVTPGTGTLKVDGGADDQEDYIEVRFEIDPEKLPEFWEEISMNLKDIIRHEIEHLTHGEGFTSKPGKTMEDDILIRKLIDAKLLPPAQYFKLEKEVDANLQGMYLRAKKEKRSFRDVIDTYLDAQDITPEEKEEILDLWRSRLPSLSLPKF